MNKRSTEEQIVRILQEAEAGTLVRDACRKHNVTEHLLPVAETVRGHGRFRRQGNVNVAKGRTGSGKNAPHTVARRPPGKTR